MLIAQFKSSPLLYSNSRQGHLGYCSIGRDMMTLCAEGRNSWVDNVSNLCAR